MRIAVIGMGNLGSAVAGLLAQNDHQVLAWDYNSRVVDEINQHHSNKQYLPDKTFLPLVTAYSDMALLLSQDPQMLVITLPSIFVPQVMGALKVERSLPLVNMSKGIDSATGETVFHFLQKTFPNNALAQLSGPSIANEFSSAVATAFVVASQSDVLQRKVSEAFANDYIAVQFSKDIVGVELGGILKNCYALGLGVLNAHKKSGLNFSGAYLTLALQEMTALAVAMGAQDKTFTSICGLGDLITTSLSEDSHNRKMGMLVAQGDSLKLIKEKLGVLAEGYNSLEVILRLAKNHHVAMPLAQLIWRLIDEELTLDAFFIDFTRTLNAKNI